VVAGLADSDVELVLDVAAESVLVLLAESVEPLSLEESLDELSEPCEAFLPFPLPLVRESVL
jgi:hypothetical protein